MPVTRLSPWRDAQLLAQASRRRRDGVQVSRLRAVHQQRASPSERSRHAHALARPKSPDDMVMTCAVDGRHGCCLLAVYVVGERRDLVVVRLIVVDRTYHEPFYTVAARGLADRVRKEDPEHRWPLSLLVAPDHVARSR